MEYDSDQPQKFICWRTQECWKAAEFQLVLLFVAGKSLHFGHMICHLSLNLRSLTNTVFVLLVVWCRWPKTHSISGMPTMKTVRRASVAVVPPCVCAQVLVVLFHSVLWDHGGLLWSTASSGVTCRAGLSDECSSRWCLVGTLALWESVLLHSAHYRSLA